MNWETLSLRLGMLLILATLGWWAAYIDHKNTSSSSWEAVYLPRIVGILFGGLWWRNPFNIRGIVLQLLIYIVTFVVVLSTFGIISPNTRGGGLEFYERNGSIVLEAEEGIWNKSSARVEIWGLACNPTSSNIDKGLKDSLEADVRRIRTLYDLDSVVVLQDLTLTENEAYGIAMTTIQVPIQAAMAEDSVRNQMGYQDIDIFQTIDIFIVRDANNYGINAYIYRGLSERLNTEAQAIVDSIKLLC